MCGGLTICELSVDDEELQSEQNDGDRNMCDDWNDKITNWVKNEMTDGYKIENWVQNELMDGYKSWNNRRWYKQLGSEKADGCLQKVGTEIGSRTR